MANLLKETMAKLNAHKKDFLQDVLWIGTSCGSCVIAKEDFLVMADFTHDDGYGSAEVIDTLVIVGEDWWLSRGKYDVSEWWDFNKRPDLKPTTIKLVSLKEGY